MRVAEQVNEMLESGQDQAPAVEYETEAERRYAFALAVWMTGSTDTAPARRNLDLARRQYEREVRNNAQ